MTSMTVTSGLHPVCMSVTTRPHGRDKCRLVRQDNYVWVLQEPSGKVAIVDPSEAEPVAKRLRELGLTPSYILNTHHHWDHTGAS